MISINVHNVLVIAVIAVGGYAAVKFGLNAAGMSVSWL